MERSGHLVRVLLCCPPVNALNRSLVAELHRAARLLRDDRQCWIVFLSTGIAHFSAGADLKERSAVPRSKVAAVVAAIQRMVRAWYDLPQPVVVGLRGAVLGGGLELALAGDILVASEDSTLGFPEVRLGIIPAAGGTQLLSGRTRASVAHRWILTGQRATAAQAARDGVIDEVATAADFTATCDRMLGQLSACAPLAVRQAKKVLRASRKDLVGRGLSAERVAYRKLISSSDREEALAAFLEKRPPEWTGT